MKLINLLLVIVFILFTENKDLAASHKAVYEPIVIDDTCVNDYVYAPCLLDYPDYKLHDWDLFRKNIYQLSVFLKANYANVEIDTIDVYNGLMSTIKTETNFRADAINPKTDAKGAIQWLPSNRLRNNIPDNINELPLHAQVHYIKDYYVKWLNRNIIITSADEVYLLVFCPAIVNKANYESVYWAGMKAYEYNKSIDINLDYHIDRQEIINTIQHYKGG